MSRMVVAHDSSEREKPISLNAQVQVRLAG
jgi:hypothetical protein